MSKTNPSKWLTNATTGMVSLAVSLSLIIGLMLLLNGLYVVLAVDFIVFVSATALYIFWSRKTSRWTPVRRNNSPNNLPPEELT